MVLGDGEPDVQVDRQIRLAAASSRPSAHRRAVHVFVHAVHVARRLEVVPAGIEADAFAYQGDGLFCLCMAVGEMDDGGIFSSLPCATATKAPAPILRKLQAYHTGTANSMLPPLTDSPPDCPRSVPHAGQGFGWKCENST